MLQRCAICLREACKVMWTFRSNSQEKQDWKYVADDAMFHAGCSI
jgi:hypothetical protein